MVSRIIRGGRPMHIHFQSGVSMLNCVSVTVMPRECISRHFCSTSNSNNWSLTKVVEYLKPTFKTKQQKIADETDEILTTNKEHVIQFQRNIPGKPTIYDGYVIEKLEDPAKKNNRVHFRNWRTLTQAILKTPSGRRGRMPLKKELDFIWPRARYAVFLHGGWLEVARKMALKAHRIPPFYIPYLDAEEQHAFVADQIDLYNEARKEQKMRRKS